MTSSNLNAVNLGRLPLLPPSRRPLFLHHSGHFPPRSGAHAATPAHLPCRPWRTACSPASSRVKGCNCRNGLVDTVALRTKFRKNPVGVHDGSSDGYPNSARMRLAKEIYTVGFGPIRMSCQVRDVVDPGFQRTPNARARTSECACRCRLRRYRGCRQNRRPSGAPSGTGRRCGRCGRSGRGRCRRRAAGSK